MNVLQIVSSSRISGAEKHFVLLSERLKQRGHNICAVCPPDGWVPDQLRDLGVDVVEMNLHGFKAATSLWKLLDLLRGRKIDIIHAHLTCATYFSCAAGRITNTPVVASAHVRSHDLVYRRFLPSSRNYLVTVSDWVRDGFVKHGVPANQVRTIYNGTEFCTDDHVGSDPAHAFPFVSEIDPNALPVRAELDLPPEAELIGLVARVEEFKGHPVLARAARRIVNARPNAYFICVGAAEDAERKKLWEITASDGVADRFRFLGVRNDVKRLMSEMTVVTLPSRYEACSMAIIESMALGKPVIATRAGGNAELILDETTGLLIDRTPEALAAAVIRLLSDSALLNGMGSAARSRARDLFSSRAMVDNIETLYQEITHSATADANSPARPAR